MDEELKQFDYVSPTERSVEDINLVRAKCKELSELLEITLKSSREKSLANTKLEEVSMWANKCIVFNQE